MQRLTINVDERVYDELQRIGGPEDISQFIESLILPQLRDLELDSAYQEMAEDKTREAEAMGMGRGNDRKRRSRYSGQEAYAGGSARSCQQAEHPQ